MKKGILSTIIISITSSINLLTFLFILLPFDAQELIENNQAEEIKILINLNWDMILKL
jgi:hypothetical protein